jgi:large subunit ribosomal protein L23
MALFGSKKTAPKDSTKKETVPKEGAKKEKAKTPVSMQDLYSGEATGKAVSAVTPSSVAGTKHNASYRILVKPLITEKATHLSSANKYIFVVARAANKIEVAKAIKAAYGFTPLKINLINVIGKKVSRGRIAGQRSDWRKAIVTLKKGEVIKIYEGV